MSTEGRIADVLDVAGRVPKHDLDAEAAVLSACLLDPLARLDVVDIVEAQHFFSRSNGQIYSAILTLEASGEPVDIVTVAAYFRQRERLVQIGGAEYLAVLSDATPSVANVANHARIVRRLSRVRRLVATCQRIAAEGYGDLEDVEEFLAAAEAEIYQVTREGTTEEATGTAALMGSMLASLQATPEEREAAPAPLLCVATGLREVDDILGGGLFGGDLIVPGARPGMGKTSFVLHAAMAVGLVGLDAWIWSGEMPRDQLGWRLASQRSGVDVKRIRAAAAGKLRLEDDESRAVTDAANEIAGLGIAIDDTPAIQIGELRARARRAAASAKRAGRRLGLVVVDSIQLVRSPGLRGNREQEVADISRQLKALAMELRVPVVAISPLSRALEQRADKRPVLSDLRESGSIESDADVVLFLYRDDYYHADSRAAGQVEIGIAKQRNGAAGPEAVAHATWESTCARFGNIGSYGWRGGQ